MNKIKTLRFLVFCVIGLWGIFYSCATPQGAANSPIADETIDNFEGALNGWSVFKHPSVDIHYSLDSTQVKEGRMAMEIEYSFRNHDPFIAFLIKDLGRSIDWSEYDGVSLWSYIPRSAKDLKDLSVMVYDEDGNAFIAQGVRNLKGTGWERSIALFSKFVFSSGKNKSGPLNLKRINKISIGIYQPSSFKDNAFSIYIDDIKLFKKGVKDDVVSRDSEIRKETALQETSSIIDYFDAGLSGWSKNRSSTLTMECSIDSSINREREKSLKLNYSFKQKKPFIGFFEKDLGPPRNWKSYDSINFWSYIPKAAKELVDLSVMLYEEDGSAYIAQHARGLKTTGWQEITIPFSKFFLAGSWTKDENDRLDIDQIKKVSIGIFQPAKFSDNEFTIYVNKIRVVQSQTSKTGVMPKISATVVRKNELQKYEPLDGSVYHGVFAFSAPMKGWGSRRSDWEEQIDPKQLAEYEKMSGRPATIASFIWFFDWDFPTEMCEKINKLGKIPHAGITMSGIKLSDIIQGKADQKIAEWASAAANYGKPVFFRFLAEMNGNWNSYSEAFDPSQTHQMYVQAWRRVVEGFRKAKADHIIWVWAPTSVDIGNIHWADYYPGDDYVDWVGMSVYSILGNGDPEPQIMGIYNDYADRKPIMIGECGAGDADNDPKRYRPGNSYSDNPEKWIQKFFDTLENKAPRVKAFIWFNIDRERVFKIQESLGKTDVYKKRLSNNRYGATFK